MERHGRAIEAQMAPREVDLTPQKAPTPPRPLLTAGKKTALATRIEFLHES